MNAVQLKGVQFENAFKKDHPYIMGLSFSKCGFQKGGEQIAGYSILKLVKIVKVLYIYKNGIVRIKFKYYY